MEAPALPRTLDDLEDWSVYADHLMTIGDPLGERIVADLAIPEAPTVEQLRGFHALVGRHNRSGQTMRRSWCLGFVRTLEVHGDRPGWFHVEHGTLAHTRDFLRSREASRLQELVIPAPTSEDRHYRRLLTALPPSCTRVTMTNKGTAALEFFLDCLPPTVTELGIQMAAWSSTMSCVLRDRFAVVDVAQIRRMDELDDLVPILAGTKTVRVRIGVFHGLPPERFELGGPDDAAIVALDPRPGRYVLGRPPKLVPLEARMAWTLLRDRVPLVILPVRELIAAETEIKNVCLDPDPRVEHPKMTLVRRNGRWTAKSWAPLSINEIAVEPKTVVPIEDGAQFEIGGRRGVFFSHQPDAKCRALLQLPTTT